MLVPFTSMEDHDFFQHLKMHLRGENPPLWECQHLLTWPASAPLPSLASTDFTHDKEAVFVLGNSMGHMVCVMLGRVRGMTSVNSLAGASSILGRVWTSLTRSAQSNQQLQPNKHVISYPPGLGLCLVCVCWDHKVRVWSLTIYDCIAMDLVQFMAESGQQLVGRSQGHRVSLAGDKVVCVYLHQHSQFLFCRLESQAGQLTLLLLSTVQCPEYNLVNYTASARGLVGVWISS